jgi:hypothetical protein
MCGLGGGITVTPNSSISKLELHGDTSGKGGGVAQLETDSGILSESN